MAWLGGPQQHACRVECNWVGEALGACQASSEPHSRMHLHILSLAHRCCTTRGHFWQAGTHPPPAGSPGSPCPAPAGGMKNENEEGIHNRQEAGLRRKCAWACGRHGSVSTAAATARALSRLERHAACTQSALTLGIASSSGPHTKPSMLRTYASSGPMPFCAARLALRSISGSACAWARRERCASGKEGG